MFAHDHVGIVSGIYKDRDGAVRNVLVELEFHAPVESTRLIRRQFAHGSRMERDLAKYGPEGTVKLSAARSIQAYMYLVLVAPVTLAATGENLAAVVAFIFLLVVFVFFLARCVSAAKAGRRWRGGRVEAQSRIYK